MAWAQLADVHAQFVFNNYDTTAERLALASSAMEKAMKLAPDNPDKKNNGKVSLTVSEGPKP